MDGYLLLAETLCREGIKDHLELVRDISVYGWRLNDRYYNATYGHLQFCRCPWFETYQQITAQKYNKLMNYCDILGGIE